MASAVFAVANAVVRQKVTLCVIACDLRRETTEEMSLRLGYDAGKQLELYQQELIEAHEAASPFDLGWLREHFPTRFGQSA